MTTQIASSHNLLLNEEVYKTLSHADKKRRLYLYEWLTSLEKKLLNASKKEIKEAQKTLIAQLLTLFNAFPGPPIRHLIAKNMTVLFSLGDVLDLYSTMDKCVELIKSKEHETQMHQMAKLCALNVIGAIYEKLGRMMTPSSYEEIIQVLFKYIKSADSQVRIEIVQTFEKILYGLGQQQTGQSIHKDIYKQLKQLCQDRVLAVRCASIKCLCEMVKHSTFLYSPPNSVLNSSSNNGPNGSNNLTASSILLNTSASVPHELEANIQLGFKALDNSNYDVRCNVAVYMAQLIFYSITQLQQHQLHLQQQQQMVNASVIGSASSANNNLSGGGIDGNSKQQKEQAAQQQQNAQAQAIMNERLKNTLLLLSNGFNKLNAANSGITAGKFNLVKGAASSLAAASTNSVSSNNNNNSNSDLNNLNNTDNSLHKRTSSNGGIDRSSASPSTSSSSSSSSSSSQVINREIRIGVTYSYVELANLLGSQWLERNLKLYINHVLNLVNGSTKAVSTHLDAVYSRKCVQFILRSIIGGMLNEKVQLQAARELIYVIEKCCSNNNEIVNQQHVLICALYELSCILKCLNTSASALLNDDRDANSLQMIEKILAALMYPNCGVKCVAAWCLRTLACSLPALMSPLLETCMDRVSMIRNPSDALLGYGYACAALLGSVNACPLGIPHLKPKIAFNIGEELLRTAKQSNNITLAMQKTSVGWLLLGSFMTLGSTVVRKHLLRMKKLWNSTMPSSLQEIESEKKRGDVSTWQLSLESRTGALSSIHSFLINCSDIVSNTIDQSLNNNNIGNISQFGSDQTPNENLLNSIMSPIEGGILLLSQLPSIIRMNSTNHPNTSIANSANATLYRLAATFRLKLYQTLLALPTPQLYESNFALLLRELVAEFTQADQQLTLVTTSTLRSVCHSNDSILFANCWVQDVDFKVIEDQLQPHSASGCESLEHDITYLYQKTSQTNSSSNVDNSTALLNITTIKPLSNSSFFSSFSSLYVTNSSAATCQAALPLGVAVIDASIQLYGVMYPKVPNKHRTQILAHFIDCIQKQSTAKANSNSKQALQINIFTAVLGSLKALAESRSDLGDESIRKNTLKLVMETLCHSNPILRCAAGEALGRMTQVVAESHFVIEVAQICFEKLKNSQDVTSRTGYALGLGCLHRYVGNMGAGQDMTSSVSILFAMAQNSASSIVQVWAIHALYLIIDSGGSMFRNFIEPCVEFIVHSVLSIPYTNRDVYVGIGKLLSSLITFMGPELQINSSSNNEMRSACLITCTVMQTHSDSMIRCEAIQCLQELHLFASKYINLKILVPYLVNSLVGKDFLVRKVAVSCLRQLCQKDSIEVCEIARIYVEETKPIGLLYLINERGLECLIFKMIDIETNPFLIRDLHDILNSILSSSLNQYTLKNWLSLCKDIAISSDELFNTDGNSTTSTNLVKNSKKQAKKENHDDDFNENDEDCDDSESFQPSFNAVKADDIIMGTHVSHSSFSLKSNNDHFNSNLKLKQITKLISPKWPNRVFAIELIRKIISMCAGINPSSVNNSSDQTSNTVIKIHDEKNLNQQAHFDLALAKKLQSQQQQNKSSETYLILFLQDLMRIACMGATSSCDPLKLVGLDLLHDLIMYFSKVEEPNPEFKGHLILEQYQAQVSAALRPQFSIETSAHVTAKACQVCSMWISSGIARDLNDLRRVHQLLVSSLQKLTNNSSPTLPTPILSDQNSCSNNNSNNSTEQQLIYSELSLTVEKLAVLRAWADVYIVAQMNIPEKIKPTLKNGSKNLLSLVQPELSILSYHWSVALKDYAFLCLPNDYSSQLPIEGGAFYHADLVESSKPIYKEHFTKILLAYSIWLNEIKFDIKELPANQKIFETNTLLNHSESINGSSINESINTTKNQKEQKEKLFFMLLGLALETLSNKTGLAQLTDETCENILEAIENLLRTSLARSILLNKSSGICLCVEILSILYKVKLTRDKMSINLLVISIVDQINEIRLTPKDPKEDQKETKTISDAEESNKLNDGKAKRAEKNSSALIFVILEICIRDLIKYLPNLLDSQVASNTDLNSPTNPSNIKKELQNNKNKASYLFMHVTTCKELNSKDVELINNVINVLNSIPFYPDIHIEKRISLISIINHILFNLIQSIDYLINKNKKNDQIEANLLKCIFNSFKTMCSTSTSISKWYFQFCENTKTTESINEHQLNQNLIKNQQSALLSTLLLKNVNRSTIMRILSIFFQYCSMKVFEPLNVYEKCKVFMCSMRCSDTPSELLTLIQCLNEILNNHQTKKELRIILLKEHLSYLLKITSTTSASLPVTLDCHLMSAQSNSEQPLNFLSINNDENFQIIKSILDLLESMVNLLSDDESLNKEHETLTIFIHILSMYLNDSPTTTTTGLNDHQGRINKELNDLILKKLLNLGLKYKNEFKQVLDKWPNLKLKIGTAIKSMNTNTQNQQEGSSSTLNQRPSNNYGDAQPKKTPKLQLNIDISKFK